MSREDMHGVGLLRGPHGWVGGYMFTVQGDDLGGVLPAVGENAVCRGSPDGAALVAQGGELADDLGEAVVGHADGVVAAGLVELDHDAVALAGVHVDRVDLLGLHEVAVDFVDPHLVVVDGEDDCFESGGHDEVEGDPAVVGGGIGFYDFLGAC